MRKRQNSSGNPSAAARTKQLYMNNNDATTNWGMSETSIMTAITRHVSTKLCEINGQMISVNKD